MVFDRNFMKFFSYYSSNRSEGKKDYSKNAKGHERRRNVIFQDFMISRFSRFKERFLKGIIEEYFECQKKNSFKPARIVCAKISGLGQTSDTGVHSALMGRLSKGPVNQGCVV